MLKLERTRKEDMRWHRMLGCHDIHSFVKLSAEAATPANGIERCQKRRGT